MGKIMTPAYRVRYRDQDGWRTLTWICAMEGRPSNAAAERYRKEMNASFQPGGANKAISAIRGYVPHISHVEVIKQATGEVVARAAMPMFEVVG
jgi:hypothetical protein